MPIEEKKFSFDEKLEFSVRQLIYSHQSNT